MEPARPLREASLPSDKAKNSPAGVEDGGGIHFINAGAVGSRGAQSRAEQSIQTVSALCGFTARPPMVEADHHLAIVWPFKPSMCESERRRGGCSQLECMNLLRLIIDSSNRSLICRQSSF